MAARDEIHGFVGRSRELTELSQAIATPDIQLVTIVGTGGVGKTRLAREIVDRSAPNSTWVSLSSIDAAAHVPLAIALARGSQIPDTAAPWEALANSMNETATVLVLDNLEQIPDLADPLTEFLTRVPRTRVLATSRTALHVAGERVLELEPLPLTTTTNGVSAASRMFINSARRVRPDFQPTSEDIEVIDQLCHRLDGLPLSIEIAAAQMRLMSPRDIMASLTEFPRHVLRLPARGDTLEATIARSYTL
ncbi:MAG: NB-ARC domain-containing protein [Thermomicrobiales bacterium]|nr:NB-ARC domain-containing protein [Thermomicrobiales bacterium]